MSDDELILIINNGKGIVSFNYVHGVQLCDFVSFVCSMHASRVTR